MNPLKQLRKENNQTEKQLNQENAALMTDMIVYLHSGKLCEYDIEIIRKELMGMALEAQLRGDSAQSVFGDDLQAFCDELMKQGRKKTGYESALEWADIIVNGFAILFLIELIFEAVPQWVAGTSCPASYLPLTAGFLFSSVLCIATALYVYNDITKHSFRFSKGRHKWLFGGIVGVLSAGIVFVKVFLNDVILGSVSIPAVCAALVVLIAAIALLENRHAYRLSETHH